MGLMETPDPVPVEKKSAEQPKRKRRNWDAVPDAKPVTGPRLAKSAGRERVQEMADVLMSNKTMVVSQTTEKKKLKKKAKKANKVRDQLPPPDQRTVRCVTCNLDLPVTKEYWNDPNFAGVGSRCRSCKVAMLQKRGAARVRRKERAEETTAVVQEEDSLTEDSREEWGEEGFAAFCEGQKDVDHEQLVERFASLPRHIQRQFGK